MLFNQEKINDTWNDDRISPNRARSEFVYFFIPFIFSKWLRFFAICVCFFFHSFQVKWLEFHAFFRLIHRNCSKFMKPKKKINKPATQRRIANFHYFHISTQCAKSNGGRSAGHRPNSHIQPKMLRWFFSLLLSHTRSLARSLDLYLSSV